MPRMNSKPILVIRNLNLASWKQKIENVYLNAKGEIYCDSFLIKDNRRRDYRRMYGFSKEYLDKRRKAYDISVFSIMNIGDLRMLMWDKDIKSISRKRIEEIVHWENQIGNIRDDIINRVKNFILKQIYKERRTKIHTT